MKELLKRVCWAVRFSVKRKFGKEGCRAADVDVEGWAVEGGSDVAATTKVQAPTSGFT